MEYVANMEGKANLESVFVQGHDFIIKWIISRSEISFLLSVFPPQPFFVVICTKKIFFKAL